MAYRITVNGTTYAVSLSPVGQQGVPGDTGPGFTGGSYNAADGTVTFTSNDGLGFSTGDLRGTDGLGFTGGSYDGGTGVVTFTSDDGLGFSTGDLRGADGLTVNWQGDWALSTAYALNDSVAHNGNSYICIQAHTSSATDEPGVGANTATYWGVLAEKGADGAGTGTVTSVDVAGGTGITSSGGPVTSSGTITVALNAASQASLALADSAAQEADVETTTVNAQTGTTYTLALTDRGQTVTMDNASANTLTIPTNASVAFAVGSVVTVIQKGAGVTTIAGATGVTVNGVSAGSGDMSAQWQGVAVMKIATDEWIVSGAIGTVA